MAKKKRKRRARTGPKADVITADGNFTEVQFPGVLQSIQELMAARARRRQEEVMRIRRRKERRAMGEE